MKSMTKEFLKLHPSIVVCAVCFAIMPIMIFIPQYPSIIGMSYFFFQIQITFELFKSSKDTEFRLLLPVRRRDIVKSRFETVMFFQAIIIAVAIPCALVSSFVAYPSGQLALDPNLAFFGMVFIYYGIFNFIFLTRHFKTGYKWGVSMLLGLAVYMVVALVSELLIAFVPFLKNTLDSLSLETLPYRIILLIVGIGFYACANILGFRIAAKRFDKVDV